MRKKLCVLSLVALLLVGIAGNVMAYDLPFNDGDVDFGGATVTYVGWWDPREGFVEGGDYAGRLEEAMERYNIGDIQYISLAWGDELRENMLNRLMSEESTYDIWCLPAAQVWPMVSADAFYPMNEVLPNSYYESLNSEQRSIIGAFTYENEKYALGLGTGAIQTAVYMVWNKEIFANEGLPELDELYLNDEWTWEKMEEIAVAATTDTSGDGEVDQWGISDIDPVPFAFSNGADPIVKAFDGDLTFGYTNEKAYYALGKLRQWISEMNIKQGDWQHLEFKAGQVAMAPMQSWMIGDPGFQDVVEFDYGIVPLPKGPNADRYYYPASADAFFVPVNAEMPKGLAALHNFLYRPEEVVEERENYVLDRARDQVSYQVLYDAYETWDGEGFNMAGVIGEWWQGDTPFGAAMGAVLWEGQSPASAMEAAEPEIQTLLDEMFDQ
ncbi:MAG: ABC transporter substrate-binding protein [Halanaerobiales bacterium]